MGVDCDEKVLHAILIAFRSSTERRSMMISRARLGRAKMPSKEDAFSRTGERKVGSYVSSLRVSEFMDFENDFFPCVFCIFRRNVEDEKIDLPADPILC